MLKLVINQRVVVKRIGQSLYLCVLHNVMMANLIADGQPVKAFHAADGHVCLSWCKSASGEVEVHTVEGHALRLVDGNGPSKLQRILGERPRYFRFHFLGLFVVHAFAFFPHHLFHINLSSIFQRHFDVVFAQLNNLGDSSIYYSSAKVITTKYHLRTNFQPQLYWNRSFMDAEVAFNVSLIAVLIRINVIQFLFIDAIGQFHKGSQNN